MLTTKMASRGPAYRPKVARAIRESRGICGAGRTSGRSAYPCIRMAWSFCTYVAIIISTSRPCASHFAFRLSVAMAFTGASLRPKRLPLHQYSFRCPGPRCPRSIRVRNMSDFGGGPSKPPNPNRRRDPNEGVMFPKTRIAIGIVFCGALIYSMASVKTRLSADHSSVDKSLAYR